MEQQPLSTFHCYRCQTALDIDPKHRVLRNEECPQCKTSIYCCKMCVFYDRTAYNECREPQAERVVDKEKANFCSYFKIAARNQLSGNSKDALLNAADALFKKN